MKDFYPLRRSEQLLFSCQSATIRSGTFIVAMVLLPHKIYFMDIVANIIEMLLNGIGLLVPIFIAAFVISLFVH